MDRYFVAGVLLGLIIAQIWRNLTRQTPPPPDKNTSIIDMRSELQRTG